MSYRKAQAQTPPKPKLTLQDFEIRCPTNEVPHSAQHYRQFLQQLATSFDLSDLPMVVLAELYAHPSGAHNPPPASFASLLQSLHDYLREPRSQETITVLAYFLAPFFPVFGITLQDKIDSITKKPNSTRGSSNDTVRESLQALMLMTAMELAYSRLRVDEIDGETKARIDTGD